MNKRIDEQLENDRTGAGNRNERSHDGIAKEHNSQSTIKVAVLPEGSTSDEAARYLFAGMPVEMAYYKPIADVFLSTASGQTDYSVIPIENTIEGSVSLHMDWLVHEVDLPIQAEWVFPSIQHLIGPEHYCLASGEVDYTRVCRLISHPVAMAQCTQFIRTYLPHAELEHMSSTVEAARLVKENPDAGWLAIAPRAAAEFHRLPILKRRITDHNNNYTRFLLIGNKPFDAGAVVAKERKTSILITLPEDYPGALHQVLSAFAWRRINLSKIESRPTKKKLGSYYFYLDILMALESVLLPAALAEIEAIGCQVRVLGSYPSYTYEQPIE